MLKRFTRYVTQSVAGMIGISVYVLADTFFISVYSGADGLAVLNLILPVYGLIYAIGAWFRYQVCHKQGKRKKYRTLFRTVSNLEHTGCSSIYADRNLYSGQSIGFVGCRCRTDRTWTKLCENYSDRNTILHVKLYIYCICQKRWSAFYCNDRFHQWKYL